LLDLEERVCGRSGSTLIAMAKEVDVPASQGQDLLMQKMEPAAKAIADEHIGRIGCGMRRQSLRRASIFPIVWRCW
jgi:hypothetical protein